VDIQYSLLKDALVFVSTAGAGVVAYWLMEQLPALEELMPMWKRYTAFVLAFIVACAGYAGLMVMQYVALPGVWPTDWRLWVETFFAVGAGAILASQVVHAKDL